LLNGDFSGFNATFKEPAKALNFTFTTRFLKSFKTKIHYNYSEVSPQMINPFMEDGDGYYNQVLPNFRFQEYGVKLKWANKETFTYLYPFGLISNGTNWPIVWTNLSFGNGTETGKFEYTKLEAQIEKRFRIYESFKTTIRVTGGNIWGDVPLSKLYSAFGVRVDKWYFETPFYFATMRPNEFASDRFVHFFWRNTFYTSLNSPQKFKPEITISTSAGWSDVSGNYPENIKTYNKGYYESGISLSYASKSSFNKMGIGMYYRYGPYRNTEKEIDNFAFVIGFGFKI
jgi:hypothetical protein